MKFAPIISALALCIAPAMADLTLEQKLETADGTHNVTIRIKGDKYRSDTSSAKVGDVSTIMDINTLDVLTLMHQQKMAVKISGETMKSLRPAGTTPPPPADTSEAKLVATGKTEKVGDYDTEIYTWTKGGTTQTLWIAKNVPEFAQYKEELAKLAKARAQGPGSRENAMTPDMSKLPGLVVKAERGSAGTRFAFTLVSIKLGDLDPALFTAPADYKLVDRNQAAGAGGGFRPKPPTE